MEDYYAVGAASYVCITTESKSCDQRKKIIGGSFSAPASHKLKFNPTGDDSND